MKYLLLFLSAFIYELILTAFNVAYIQKKIFKSVFLVGLYEPFRWVMIIIISSTTTLGSFDQLVMIGIVVFAFQCSTFLSLKYLHTDDSWRELFGKFKAMFGARK